MGDGPITRAEHEEFAKRIEKDQERNNARLAALEDNSKQINSLVVSVEKLALSMKQLAEEQREQNTKLDNLEERDGEMWRKVVGYIITAVIGIIIGFVFKQIGF